MKNRYYALLRLKHELGILSGEEKILIKQRTLYSWNTINYTEQVGYNPNDPLICDKSVFAFVHSQNHVRNLLKVYMSLFACMRAFFRSISNVNEKLRKCKTKFIDSYNFCKQYITAKKFRLLTGVSSQKINRWQHEIICRHSVLEQCSKENPHQLSLEEQNLIARELQTTSNEHLFKCDLWAKLLRKGLLYCRLSAFYKYARMISHKLGLEPKKHKLPPHRIKAKAPFMVLHVDCTVIHTEDGRRWYINIIFDNFSKAILGIKAMLAPNSFDVMQNLKQVIDEYKLHNTKISFYCDGGPENRGWVDVFINSHGRIKKFVTSIYNGIHNNMIESFNSKLKRRLFLLLDLSDHEKVPQQLTGFKKQYNNIPQALLKTLSPNEVINGLIPGEDLWPEIENGIDEAKNTRLLTNMISCCK